ncbi:MAG TPA: MarR family transcriptional regulator [Steroidobacteraceae bacterium]|nr:MarR family transcriptional regulator [Steroidobacteraceae bacterium]
MRSTPRQPLIRLIDEVTRLRGRLQSVFADASAATGLAPMESTVLTAVVKSGTAPTVSQIGRSLGHPRQVIQRATNNLIAARLLQTAANPSHKRALLLRATPAGRRRYRDAEAIGRKAAASFTRLLNRKECDRLADELHALRGRIETHLRARERVTKTGARD